MINKKEALSLLNIIMLWGVIFLFLPHSLANNKNSVDKSIKNTEVTKKHKKSSATDVSIAVEIVAKGVNGEIIPSKYYGTSMPRPSIRIKDLTKSSIKINEKAKTATITIECVEILDPVADNLPEGVGEIKNVKVEVDGEEKYSKVVKVTSVVKGREKPSFWKQHPYKGTFKKVSIMMKATLSP